MYKVVFCEFYCSTHKRYIYIFYVLYFIFYEIYEHVGVPNLMKDRTFDGPYDLATYFPNFYTMV